MLPKSQKLPSEIMRRTFRNFASILFFLSCNYSRENGALFIVEAETKHYGANKS